MAKIYLSSRYEDLKKERESAAKAGRSIGHSDIAMKNDVTYDKRPEIAQTKKNRKNFPKRKWILVALAIVILLMIAINYLYWERIPKEVTYVKSKGISVSKNDYGFWEADYGEDIIMVYIEAGKFTMGSNDYVDEKPIHTVSLDGYWMGKYEVTFAQYDKYCEATGKNRPDDEGWGRGDRPVINVSWDDANAYCDWLSTEKNLTFKLPSEAQWEKAARGVVNLKYPWGDHDPYYNGKWYANYMAHSSWEKRGEDGFEFTAPVGSYKPGASPYGLLDMAGNVWEWCNDWYDKYSAESQKNPTGPSSGSGRVIRGGSWNVVPRSLYCANRGFFRSSSRWIFVGFRLCQDN